MIFNKFHYSILTLFLVSPTSLLAKTVINVNSSTATVVQTTSPLVTQKLPAKVNVISTPKPIVKSKPSRPSIDHVLNLKVHQQELKINNLESIIQDQQKKIEHISLEMNKSNHQPSPNESTVKNPVIEQAPSVSAINLPKPIEPTPQTESTLTISAASSLPDQSQILRPTTKKIKYRVLNEFKLTANNSDQRRLGVSQIAPELDYELMTNFKFHARADITLGGVQPHAGGSKQKGSLYISNFYYKYYFTQYLNLSFGQLFIPIGSYNPNNNPHLLTSVDPSDLESIMIPANWSENGFLISYSRQKLSFKMGIFNSIDASTMTASDSHERFINDGIQNGLDAQFNDLMGLLSIDWNKPESTHFNATILYGGFAQKTNLNSLKFALMNTYAELYFNQVYFKASYVEGFINDSFKLNSLGGVFPQRVNGFYIQAIIKPKSPLNWLLRYSNYDLNTKPGLALSSNPKLIKSVVTVGSKYNYLKSTSFKGTIKLSSDNTQSNDLIGQLAITHTF